PLDPTDDEYEAENRRTRTLQRSVGAGLQLAQAFRTGALRHRLTLGLSHDRGRTDFRQYEQPARFTADRGTEPDGDFELDVAVRGINRYEGFYVSDTISPTERTHITLSARYNRALVEIRDLTGTEPDLNGRHRFQRITPAVGATHLFTPELVAYAALSQGFRVPTPVELTCADPDAPCSLPVAFVADPELEPVVSTGWELGLRSSRAAALQWQLGVFRTDLRNDILFTAVGAGRGFFANVPKTRRQGLEAAASGERGPLRWSFAYAYVDATYRVPAELFNPVALAADPAQPETLSVRAGDRLPGIPRHRAKAAVQWRFTDTLSAGLGATHVSSQYLRGDDNNRLRPLAGYAVFNLRAEAELARHWRLLLRVDNLFDKRYATLGALNRNAFDADNEPLEGAGPGPVQRFVAPGAPRSVWFGLEYRSSRL
ncbi:MAG: TonB-dependent receptor, partial [Burkholderiaceae bacterium]|nr:TonB-dependent receptor [Burkholderiaceae bacterium]